VHRADRNYRPLLCYCRLTPAGRKFPAKTSLEKSTALLPYLLKIRASLTDTWHVQSRFSCPHLPQNNYSLFTRLCWGPAFVQHHGGKGTADLWDHLYEQQAQDEDSRWCKWTHNCLWMSPSKTAVWLKELPQFSILLTPKYRFSNLHLLSKENGFQDSSANLILKLLPFCATWEIFKSLFWQQTVFGI